MTALADGPGPVARTYGGWQRDRSAFAFGLSPLRAGMCAAAVLCAVIPLVARSLGAALLFVPLGLLLVAAAFVRVAGRYTNEWAADAARFTVARRSGTTAFLAAPPAPADTGAWSGVGQDGAGPGGHVGRRGGQGAGPAMDLPGTLAPLRFLRAETGRGTHVAVVHHPLDNTFTVVARISGAGLSLADTSRRDARVAGWGSLLASLCTETNAIVRVQACVRAVPGDSTALRRWHSAHVAASAPAVAVANAEQLLAASGAAGAQHETWLVFTLSGSRARADIRAAGGGDSGGCAVAWRRVHALEEGLRQANLPVQEWLDVRGLAEAVRTGFDPASVPALSARRLSARAALDATGVNPGLAPGLAPHLAGPAAADTGWKSYTHDGATSVTFAVADWPRTNVHASFLTPVLHSAGARRSFSLHVEPLGPREARRRIAVEATKAETALALARKTGRVVSEEEREQRRRIGDQDREQAVGHGLVRFQGYLTVTVTDPAQLDRAVSDLEADAAAARLELRRLYTQQDVGFFACVLPLGQGLPLRRAGL